MSSASSTTRHFDALDGIRAIAAFAVVATHAGFNSGRSLDRGPFAPFLARLDFGVTLFFLLSGFLLFRPFASAAIAAAPGPSVPSFWWRRFLRIMPAYWLAVVVMLAVTNRPHTGKDWLSYLTLTQTYTGHDLDPHLTQMWTLVVEISFYAILPLLSVLTRRLFRNAELTGQLALVATLALTASVSTIVIQRVWSSTAIGMLWLPAYLDWFALGMFLAVASCVQPEGRRWRTTLGEWAQYPGTCWAVAGALFWMSTLPLAGPRDLHPSTTWEWMTRHLLYGATAFFLLLPATLGSSGWVRAALGNKVARWLGEVSYGVFLWHLGLLLIIQRALGFRTFGGHFAELFLLAAASATAVAALSWHFYERPLLRRFSRPWRRGGDQQREGDQAQRLHGRAVAEGVG